MSAPRPPKGPPQKPRARPLHILPDIFGEPLPTGGPQEPPLARTLPPVEDLALVLAARVYAMRLQAIPLRRIAELLGLEGEMVAATLYEKALNQRVLIEDRRAEYARVLASDRLDMIEERTRHALLDGDLGAAKVWLKAEERRAKLWGLDMGHSAQQGEALRADLEGLSDTQLVREMAQMMGLTAPDLARLAIAAAQEEEGQEEGDGVRAEEDQQKNTDGRDQEKEEKEDGDDDDDDALSDAEFWETDADTDDADPLP